MIIKKIPGFLSLFLLIASVQVFAVELVDNSMDKVQAPNPSSNTVNILRSHFESSSYANWASDLEWNTLKAFYAQRNYAPIWLDQGMPNQRATYLLDSIINAYLEGLDPAEYHVSALRYMWRAKRQLTKARLELLLTDAFFRYAREVGSGYYYPKAVDFDWNLSRKKIDVVALLKAYLASTLPDMFLTYLPPTHEAYVQLKSALAKYRSFARKGGWKKIKHGPALKLGDKDARIRQLRNRLRAEGYAIATAQDASAFEVYDKNLEVAVKQFQALNGHKVDGIVGWFTLRSLNIAVEQRISQIKKNMERWRWLPENLGKNYIMVNMAGYELSMVHNYRKVLSMPVVVGKPVRATPTFADSMDYLEFNPSWKIPPRIAKEKFLPKLQENPDFINTNRMQVFNGWAKSAEELDPASINWKHYSPDRWFPFKLVQTPGEHNSLGRIKFMFPNKYRIYLHDTPEKELFAKNVRTFSAGCVRVSDPYLLAENILQHEGDWSRDKIKQIVTQGKTQQVRLNNKWPVYLLYWTTWVDEAGRVNFRKDVYRRNTYIAAGKEPDYGQLFLAQNSF